jgi:hypothetical protein
MFIGFSTHRSGSGASISTKPFLWLRSGLRQRGRVCSPAYPPLRLRLRSPQGGLPSPRASGALNRTDSKHHRQPGIRGNGGSPQEPGRVHFILSPQQGSGAQDGKHEGDVVARTRLDASWDNIRPFLFFARPSCEMLYFEMFYLMTPRSESSMNLMSIVTSSLKSASALSFSRACVVLSLEFNSSL